MNIFDLVGGHVEFLYEQGKKLAEENSVCVEEVEPSDEDTPPEEATEEKEVVPEP